MATFHELVCCSSLLVHLASGIDTGHSSCMRIDGTPTPDCKAMTVVTTLRGREGEQEQLELSGSQAEHCVNVFVHVSGTVYICLLC